ncbi:D-alanyl-D-alanine carboxypeptidase/D-alanyl-D-alanine-endopeptidase [Comamonas odontotermitis]|nr:D-alanyl-D-alanine carboxypeptidase/D-alanyl-D-alanine-endopeptidase [Comamonas odontotermitis]UBB16877.1 D-alanyl-D-alanine carboxypeptidase/D-alanyl-D-alanine-endopeptidase [Comamonas odontotermitis]
MQHQVRTETPLRSTLSFADSTSNGSRPWLQSIAIAMIALGQVACAQTPAMQGAERTTPAAGAVQVAPNPSPAVRAPVAQSVPAAPVQPASTIATGRLPAEVEAALQRGKLAPDSVSVVVMDASGTQRPLLDVRSDVQRNPASVMKLVTTFAALELLGPAYTWDTSVSTDGSIAKGALNGNLYIQGSGDPKLVMERLWLMQRRLQDRGVKVIVGDVVLDRSAFQLPPIDPAYFDNEPFRPYNAVPDALLVNYKSMTMSFMPDAAAGVARIAYEPAIANMNLPATVPLVNTKGGCGNWRAALKANFAVAGQIQFAGGYPAACEENSWSVAPAAPESFAPRVFEGMWREAGGKITGQVRFGTAPQGAAPLMRFDSPSLTEVVRDINKYSNNVMAQQVFLTLGKQRAGVGTFEGGRQAVAQWWSERMGGMSQPTVDNGAGLSRDARVTAGGLAKMLSVAWTSNVMPELMASMPIVGVDGTMKKSKSSAVGGAHLKTGTLRDASAIAGYVNGANGRRWVVVALANSDNAPAARPAWDALIDWVAAQ